MTAARDEGERRMREAGKAFHQHSLSAEVYTNPDYRPSDPRAWGYELPNEVGGACSPETGWHYYEDGLSACRCGHLTTRCLP